MNTWSTDRRARCIACKKITVNPSFLQNLSPLLITCLFYIPLQTHATPLVEHILQVETCSQNGNIMGPGRRVSNSVSALSQEESTSVRLFFSRMLSKFINTYINCIIYKYIFYIPVIPEPKVRMPSKYRMEYYEAIKKSEAVLKRLLREDVFKRKKQGREQNMLMFM